MKFTRSTQQADAVIDLTAMLDIVFNLLLFFMVATQFAQPPGLKVDLPKTQSQEGNRKANDTVISIDSSGQIAFKDKVTDIVKLKEQLLSLPRTTVMVLRADARSSHGRVIEVMDLVKQMGFSELAIATEHKSGT